MLIETRFPGTAATPAIPATGALRPLAVDDVEMRGGFWGDLQALNATAIIPHAAGWMERLEWTTNLADAASDARYEHRGRQFADSEIYKLIEAMSWDRARGRADADSSSELDAILDRFLTLVAGAQDPDGYLHTLFGRAWQQPRYSDFTWGHELYCFGHLLQAAVAHHRATGETRFLDVAIRLADHVCVMFGADGLDRVCGHAEIELGLVELYRETGERRYLDQAAIFVERRGTGTLPLFEFGAAYWQDDMPVRAADVLRGHAVRALYLAAGAVDVAIETGDDNLLAALVTQWDTTVAHRTYITGGMGSHHMDEAFGDDFVLPPDRSYCETCAGVASILFSWRLLLATGDVKYADLIERTLFNIVATAPASDGRSFFYANTLHQRVEHALPALNDDGVVIRGGAAGRQPWFEVSCCPPNLARTLASLGAYLATGSGSAVQLHQFASGRIRVGDVLLDVETAYPADGRVQVTVLEAGSEPVSLSVRVPGWATGATLESRGSVAEVAPGYAVADGLSASDVVTLDLPLEVRVVEPDRRIDAVRGTVAIERGPEVYALESVDLPDGWTLDEALIDTSDLPGYDGATVRVRLVRTYFDDRDWPFGTDPAASGASETAEVPLVRYHAWAERGSSTMRIFIPRR